MTRAVSGSAGEPPTAAELLELMSVLAHDLRTPLTPVKGYAEILRTRANLGPDKTAQYAAIIVEAAARMERSVNLLAGISALYGGRAEIRPETMRAVDVIAERLDIWRGREPARSFEGHTEAAYGGVVADRGWLGKALDVLIDQALRAWPAPAAITLGARTNPGGESTCFSVDAIGEGNSSAAPNDRIGRVFLAAVSDVCGYPLTREVELEVPAAPVA